jgi:hypothetical protein
VPVSQVSYYSNKAQAIEKRGEEPLRQALYRISGVDLTGIAAICVQTVQLAIGAFGPI